MAAEHRGDESVQRDRTDVSAQFLELKARAKNLGWRLVDEGTGYLLRPVGRGTAIACTSSATPLDAENAGNPSSGLNSVSLMLNQIEAAQRKSHR